jgi:glycosyltransferase involved in cell wall biosynthesis
MRKMPRISVIVPTYNCAAYIPDAIDSVLKQTCQDFEIIIVDDGSTDDTVRVLDKYRSNPCIKYVYQENKGPGAARNAGMKLSQGEYICFLDSDDQLYRDSLQLRREFLDRQEDVMMVFTDYGLKKIEDVCIKKYLADNKFLESFKDSFVKRPDNAIVFNDKFIDLFYGFSPHPIWTGTVMMKKSVVGSVGYFRTDTSIGEDRDYWIRIADNHKIGYIDEPTAMYNHFRSYLTKDVERYCLERIKSLKNTPNQSASRKKIVQRNISDTYLQLGYYFYKKNRRRSAMKYLLSGLQYNYRNRDCAKYLIINLLPQYLIDKIKIIVKTEK